MGIRLPQINFVGTLMILVVVCGFYAAAKFTPVYLQATEVESILDSYRHDASRIDPNAHDGRELRILEAAASKIAQADVDERYLDVYFSDNLDSFHADYQVVVRFPFGQSMTLELERSVKVPR